MTRRLTFAATAALLAISAGGTSLADAYIPANDRDVVEVLPYRDSAAVAALRIATAAHTHSAENRAATLNLVRAALDAARSEGDPRFLGQAAALLAPLLARSPDDPEAMILRATILQATHDFAQSLKILDRVIARYPNDPQALLTRASVRLVRGDNEGSLEDCGRFAQSHTGLGPDSCIAAAMAARGLGATALRALTLSYAANSLEAARAPRIALFAAIVAAETAVAIGNSSARSWFDAAREIAPQDPYLLASYTDFLLAEGQANEVVELLSGKRAIDPLLLRLAIAERMTGHPAATADAADLLSRFAAAHLRGDTIHRREEARFRLTLLGDAAGARDLACANWQVQREAQDAAILLAAAIAAGDRATAAMARAAIQAAGWREDALLGPITSLVDTHAPVPAGKPAAPVKVIRNGAA